MNKELLKPDALFEIAGKSALVVGASGALGRIAALTIGAAGGKITLAAGNLEKLAVVAREVGDTGAEVRTVNRRPDTVADAEEMVATAVDAYGGLDLAVVASGMNKSAKINDSSSEDFEAIMKANLSGSWNACRAAGARMIEQGRGGQNPAHLVDPRQAGASRRLFLLLHVEIRRRRPGQGARLRMGRA